MKRIPIIYLALGSLLFGAGLGVTLFLGASFRPLTPVAAGLLAGCCFPVLLVSSTLLLKAFRKLHPAVAPPVAIIVACGLATLIFLLLSRRFPAPALASLAADITPWLLITDLALSVYLPTALLLILAAAVSRHKTRRPGLEINPIRADDGDLGGRASDYAWSRIESLVDYGGARRLAGFWVRPVEAADQAWAFDTAFASLALAPACPELSRRIFDPFWRHARESGYFPRRMAAWGQDRHSTLPLFAETVMKRFLIDGDIEALGEDYEKLRWLHLSFDRHWAMEDGPGYHFNTAVETELDNTARFSDTSGLTVTECVSVAAVDLTSMIAHSLWLMSKMAKILGRPDQSWEHKERFEQIGEFVRTRAWSRKDGFFYDVRRNRAVRRKAVAGFYPLYAELATKAQAAALVRNMVNRGSFWAAMPLPTWGMDEKDFELDYGRGPVSLPHAYFVVLGLKKYGYRKLAAETAARLVGSAMTVFESTDALWEFYNPQTGGLDRLTRKKGNRRSALVLGAKPLRDRLSTLAAVHLLWVEELIGYKVFKDAVVLHPHLPARWAGKSFQVSDPARGVELALTLEDADTVRCAARLDSKGFEFRLPNFEPLVLPLDPEALDAPDAAGPQLPAVRGTV